MVVKMGDFVRVHYTGKVDGEIFDSSKLPFSFSLGSGDVIQGFQNAVIGMEPNQKKVVTIKKEEAYGVRDETLVSEIPLDNLGELPKQVDLKPGVSFQLKDKLNNSCIVTVKDLKESSIVLDLNHPLAGKDLEFEIKLLEHLKN